MPNTAFFPGSFNPFTIGHANIVSRALDLFDTVIIGIGINSGKEQSETDSSDLRAQSIIKLYEGNPRVKVTVYYGLTARAAKEAGAEVLIRGIRSVADFEYEREIADVNHDVFGMDTLLLMADPKYSSVSSSMVRELKSYGVDVSRYLPDSIHS